MGLSASQARLLSITQRINNNELKSQLLANNKIRLAEDSSVASRKYVDALSSKKLEYKVYKNSGTMEQVALSFNALNNYNELQSQYGVMSATGQIYVSEADGKNFEGSNNLYEFLQKYDLCTKDEDDNFVVQNTNKAQWYTNLWYKMDAQDGVGLKLNNFGENGLKTLPDLEGITKMNGKGNYLILDDVLGSSSTWLQFALQNGLATLTKIQTDNDLAESCSWKDLEYTSAIDIVECDDDTQIQRAEVEYEQETKRIQAEDKKIDLDIKKLDTEHSSLKSEYDSIKNVLGKNVERSFNAFS